MNKGSNRGDIIGPITLPPNDDMMQGTAEFKIEYFGDHRVAASKDDHESTGDSDGDDEVAEVEPPADKNTACSGAKRKSRHRACASHDVRKKRVVRGRWTSVKGERERAEKENETEEKHKNENENNRQSEQELELEKERETEL